MSALEGEAGSNIDVVGLCLRAVQLFRLYFGEVWKRGICGIESEGACGKNGYRNFEGTVEIWLESKL